MRSRDLVFANPKSLTKFSLLVAIENDSNNDLINLKKAIKIFQKINKPIISVSRVLNDNLRVMDMTAITLCKENNLPIRVFNINHTGDLKALVLGSKIGTLVSE